jgi:hypothetical protein
LRGPDARGSSTTTRIVYTKVNGTKESPRLDIIVFDPATKASATLLSGNPNVLGGVPRFGPDGTVAVGRHEPSGDKAFSAIRVAEGRPVMAPPAIYLTPPRAVRGYRTERSPTSTTSTCVSGCVSGCLQRLIQRPTDVHELVNCRLTCTFSCGPPGGRTLT